MKSKYNIVKRICLLLIIVFFVITSIFFTFINIKNAYRKRILPNYVYTSKKNVDYVVQIYDNNFIKGNTMPKGKVYLSDLVRNISFNINYDYSSNKKSNLKCNYNVTGKLSATYNNDSNKKDIVWEKEFSYINRDEYTMDNSSSFNINEDIIINYNNIRKEVDKFKEELGIYINANFSLVLDVYISGTTVNGPININDKVILNFPVGVNAFSISEDYEKIKEEIIYKKNIFFSKINYILLLLSIILFIISNYLFIKKYGYIFNKEYNSKYEKRMNKILSSYGNVVIEILNPPNEMGYEVIYVNNFSEIIDIQEQIKVPINLYKMDNHSEFSVIYDKLIYKYILSKNDN